MTESYETIIGLEVHLQLATRSKAFCGCSTEFGREPNSQTCPVCLGFPGVLPVLNQAAFESSIKVALALNSSVADFVKFDRKNYYYPDLPKNYQISQFDRPLALGGFVEVDLNGIIKRIRIRRVHMEEDAGKLIHMKNCSLVDFNRAGIPLLEIVTEPDITSPGEAYQYLVLLKSILQYLEVSDCDMEKGSLRCDANVSIRKTGETGLGTKSEIKNMNSFKGVQKALEYEVNRQEGLLKEGGVIRQETRLWDADREETFSMRSKEEAHDYRYFPEPDLVPFIIDKGLIEEIRHSLPELPYQKKKRFIEELGLSVYDAGVLSQDRFLAGYYERCLDLYPNPKAVANWLMVEVLGILNSKGKGVEDLRLKPEDLAEMLKMIDNKVISGKIAKDVLLQMMESGKPPRDIVKEKGMEQISDRSELDGVIDGVLKENSKSVQDYKNGKEKAFTFLVGQVMAKTRGKANPSLVNQILKEKLTK